MIMPKYRKTICQDKGFSNGMWLITPIDLRKKFYFCNHCQKEHLVKEGLVKEIGLDKSKRKKPEGKIFWTLTEGRWRYNFKGINTQ